jgi:hypothetical protein
MVAIMSKDDDDCKDPGKPKSKSGQNSTTIAVGYVGPGERSNYQLGPGLYSLNRRANVPFVQFIGSAGFRKVFSWGEITEVPEGQLVTVGNASYHGGDIFLNRGADMCNRPSRITVPVPYKLITFTQEDVSTAMWVCSYPCDTRAAKRAYLNVDAFVNPLGPEGGGPLTAFIRGRRLDGSMNTVSSLQAFTPPFGPAVGFFSAISYPVLTDLNYIPFGQGADMGDDTRPHNLLDAGDIFFFLGPPFPFVANPLLSAMSWPADIGVFGFPIGQMPAPGTWYVIEYD